MKPSRSEDHLVDLDLDPNEASGLQRVGSRQLLERYGWDLGLWSVLDEVDGHRSSMSRSFVLAALRALHVDISSTATEIRL